MEELKKYVMQKCSICDCQTPVPGSGDILVISDVAKGRTRTRLGGHCKKCNAVYCFDHIRWSPDPDLSIAPDMAVTGRCPICSEYVGSMS